MKKTNNSSGLLHEAFNTPIAGEYDVIVCGGGPAGIAAAISAARSGAHTMLIESHGCLGGVWTAGALCWIIDHKNKSGIMTEIIDRLANSDLNSNHAYREKSAYDVESMKLLLEKMAAEANVRVRLHSRVVAAHKNAQARLTHIATESKSGREAWKAKVFIDATGDGDLAALAGCRYEIGHPEHGETQPMSLMALITGIDPVEVKQYHARSLPNEQSASKENLLRLLLSNGHDPSYTSPTLFCIHDDLFGLMANHEYGVSALNADDITQATINARTEITKIIQTLRKSGGPWKNVSLVATAEQIGIREGRRILGRYTVTADDLHIGKQHEDAICTVTFGIDVHSTNKNRGKSYDTANRGVRPYQIPLRAAIPMDVDGLLLAGRCISGDFLAHASYRVTGNAVTIGEKIGSIAARWSVPISTFE